MEKKSRKKKSTVETQIARTPRSTKPEEMTDQELREAAAKIAGYYKGDLCDTTGIHWFRPDHMVIGDDKLPDYPHDLNAVHEIEKCLTPSQHASFRVELAGIISAWDDREYVSATARQRCIALTRVFETSNTRQALSVVGN